MIISIGNVYLLSSLDEVVDNGVAEQHKEYHHEDVVYSPDVQGGLYQLRQGGLSNLELIFFKHISVSHSWYLTLLPIF